MDRAFYLEAWNGSGAFEIDRIGRGSSYIPALCVSILGGIQPGPLSSYVYETVRGGRGDDGLLQRFQLLVWPDPPKGAWRKVDRYPDKEAKNRAYAVYEALDSLDPEEFGAATEHDGNIPAVGFSSGSQEIFDDWRAELEAVVRDEDLSPALRNHLAKYRSLMPSLALVFHLMDHVNGSGGEDATVVSVEAAQRAAAWCEYLRTHAERLYGSAESPAVEGARALLSRIRRGDVVDGATIREVYRKQWSRLSTSEEVGAAAAVLEDYGWLRVEKVETGGRPTARLRLHPSLHNGPEGGA
jgi:putative DNA primase/helicase